MTSQLQFLFRGKMFTSEVCIDCAENPFFVLILLKDKQLIAEFGKEITILTDYISLVARRNDAEELSELRQSIFQTLKFHPMFSQAAAYSRNTASVS